MMSVCRSGICAVLTAQIPYVTNIFYVGLFWSYIENFFKNCSITQNFISTIRRKPNSDLIKTGSNGFDLFC